MMKRKGLSEIVSTVLIVLITIAAVAFVANLAIPFVRNNLQSSTECIASRGFFKFDDAQGYDCYDQNGLYGFSVQAGNGGEVTASDQPNNQPHSADYNKDWIISLDELNNFIRLYNYRTGNVRTGDYHCDSKTIDGYAPGPATQSGSAASIGNNITGFALVFGSSSNSETIKVIDGTAANSVIGGVRMLDTNMPNIYVPRPGETQTFVYNVGSQKYSQIDVYPILQSGRLCDKSDSITISLCKGVSLTP